MTAQVTGAAGLSGVGAAGAVALISSARASRPSVIKRPKARPEPRLRKVRRSTGASSFFRLPSIARLSFWDPERVPSPPRRGSGGEAACAPRDRVVNIYERFRFVDENFRHP